MAAEIETNVPAATVTLIPGGRGIFDVKRDGTLVFSKYDEDRFPNDGELRDRLQY